jgi:hypothetical protein
MGYYAKEQAIAMKEIFQNSKVAEKAMKEWSKKKVTIDIATNRGITEPTTYTIQEWITLHQYGKQLDLTDAFVKRGWDMVNEKGEFGETFRSIEKGLREAGGEEAIKWSEWMTNDLYPRLYHKLNEKYREHKGTDLDHIVNYSPVFRETGKRVEDRVLFDMPVEDYVASTLTSSSKSRQKNSNWFNVRSANENMNNHIERVLHYVNFQDAVNRLDRAFGESGVRDAISDRYGDIGNKVMDKFIKDISHDVLTGDRWRNMDKLRSRFVRAKLGFNLILLPKQIMSVDAYRAELSAGEQLEFTANLFKVDWGVIKKMSQNPWLRSRYAHSSFDRELAIQEKTFSEFTTVEQKSLVNEMVRGHNFWDAINPMTHLKDNMLLMTKLGDAGAILYGGQAMYRVKYNTYLREGYTPGEAGQKAFNDWVRSTRKTQQSGVTEDLSHFQRAGSWGKMLSLFQNTPMQYLRLELAAMDAISQARRDKDKKKMVNAAKDFLLFHVVLPTTFQAASNGFYIDDILDPDKGFDAEWWEDPAVKSNMIAGGLQYTPFAGELLMGALNYYNSGFAYEPGVGVLSDILKETTNMYKLAADVIQGDTDKLTAQDVVKRTALIPTMMGIPVNSLWNLGSGVEEFVSGETHDARALLGYSPAMRGQYSRSPDYGLIHKHMPSYGGSIATMFKEVAEKEGFAYLKRNKKRLQDEYVMYSMFGGNDRHVNFMYSSLRNNKQRAKYVYDLWKGSVPDTPARGPARNLALRDWTLPERLSEEEFNRRMMMWVAGGAIDKQVVEYFQAMKLGKFEELYEY